MSIIIGVQGAQGSFSQTAAQQFIEKMSIPNAKLSFLISAENVLAAVEKGEVNYGIFAIENSRGGVVTESIYALANHNCHILTLFDIKISQNLLVKPGTLFTNITEIHSHQQALRQCQHYLNEYLPHCLQIEEDDTALSAKQLSDGIFPSTSAVIANAICAPLYGLELLAKNIQDLQNNLTLFAATTKKS